MINGAASTSAATVVLLKKDELIPTDGRSIRFPPNAKEVCATRATTATEVSGALSGRLRGNG
jgi:hypothetical protein